MIILSLHRRIHRPSHTPQMYLYRLVLLSCKGLFYKRGGGGNVVTDRDRGGWHDNGLPLHETISASPVLDLLS